MNNETYSNLKYLSNLKKISNVKALKIVGSLEQIKKVHKKKISEKNIISTCQVTGNKKRTYRATGLNRHFVRTKYIRQQFTI